MAKTDKALLYHQLTAQLQSLYENENNFMTNAANLCSLVFYNVANVNWAGFYWLKQQELVVGPYQGRIPCTRIPLGKGVCGIAAQQMKIQIENDVLSATNYIACDHETRAEIVVPVIVKKVLIGVFDVDSTLKNNFDQIDAEGLQLLVDIFAQSTKINFHLD